MNRDKIIKDSKVFSKIISTKNNIKNKYMSIYYEKGEKNLYGITIPKKYGKAYIRNKTKRQIKNIIITNEKIIPKDYSYVIIIKEATHNLDYDEMAIDLIKLLKKVSD